MTRNGFRIVPRMISINRFIFDIVLPNGEYRTIAQCDFPNDNQMNDNMEAAQAICDILKKRIRKSV